MLMGNVTSFVGQTKKKSVASPRKTGCKDIAHVVRYDHYSLIKPHHQEWRSSPAQLRCSGLLPAPCSPHANCGEIWLLPTIRKE